MILLTSVHLVAIYIKIQNRNVKLLVSFLKRFVYCYVDILEANADVKFKFLLSKSFLWCLAFC